MRSKPPHLPLLFIFSLLLVGSSVHGETTDVSDYESLSIESSEQTTCEDKTPASLSGSWALAGLQCSPMAFAVGASPFKKKAPLFVAAVAKTLGRAGPRLMASLNWVGTALAVGEVSILMGNMADFSRQCQLKELPYKTFALNQLNLHGELLRKNLTDGGHQLTSRQLNRLRVPPGYLQKDRIQKMSCGKILEIEREVQRNQGKVYKELISVGAVVAYPDAPKVKVAPEDLLLIDELQDVLRCMPPGEMAQVICSVGSTLLFGKEISKEIRKLIYARKKSQKNLARVVRSRSELHKAHMVGNLRFPKVSHGIYATVISRALRSGTDAKLFDVMPSKRERLAAQTAANRAHSRHNVDKQISAGAAGSLLSNFGAGTPRRLSYFQRILASGNNTPLKMVSLQNANVRQKIDDDIIAQTHTAKGFASEANRFRVEQSEEGKKYLADIGESLNEALWSPEMKALSTEWRSQLKDGTHKLQNNEKLEDEFTKNLDNLIKMTLLKNHPELGAKVSAKDFINIFGRSTPELPISDQTTKAEALVMVFKEVIDYQKK